MTTQVVVHPDKTAVAAATAARLLTALVDLQADGGVPRIGLTGGGVGIALLEQLREHPARDTVDWARVEFYWGDERFLPAGDPERNETQAREALLDHVGVDPAKVFAMGAGPGDDLAAAADAADEYARTLADRASDTGARVGDDAVPVLDVLMLGMGGEGHTASVFPHSPAVASTGRAVVAVYDCPKPPPTRVSLTLPAVRTAAEVWIVTAGEEKADAVAQALGGASEVDIPVAGARGSRVTRWLIDRAAAAKLPS